MASSGAMTSSGADLVTVTSTAGGGGGVVLGGGGVVSGPNVLHFPNLQNRFGIVGTVTSKVLEQTSLSVHFFCHVTSQDGIGSCIHLSSFTKLQDSNGSGLQTLT